MLHLVLGAADAAACSKTKGTMAYMLLRIYAQCCLLFETSQPAVAAACRSLLAFAQMCAEQGVGHAAPGLLALMCGSIGRQAA